MVMPINANDNRGHIFKYGTTMRLLIVLFTLINALLFSYAAWASSPRIPIGTNLARIDDWSTDMPFTDFFKTSRPWISGTAANWKDGRTIDVDSSGWVRSLLPGQVVRTLLFWDLSKSPGQYPSGRYVVDYKGEGVIEYGGSAKLVARTQEKDILDVEPSRGGGIAIEIKLTNPNNYIRNIRVYREGTDPSSQTFNPEFLDRLRNYKAIRFMDWMATNGDWSPKGGSRQKRWIDRPKLTDARWSNTHGVPLEIMANLANTLKADPWFCMPHLADDEYVRNFAELANSLVSPSLRIYVEHSNEVWNRGFEQARYAQERGLALELDSNPKEAQVRYHSKRSVEIFDIWSKSIAKQRLIRVLGAQATNAWFSEAALSYQNSFKKTDVLAIAPYFSVRGDESAKAMTIDALFASLESSALPKAKANMAMQKSIAQKFGVSLIAYEAGQHLVAEGPLRKDSAINTLFDNANRDKRMRLLYKQYLKDWTEIGGGMLMHFTHVTSARTTGRFGSLEYMTQPRDEAPKYDALQLYIEGK